MALSTCTDHFFTSQPLDNVMQIKHVIAFAHALSGLCPLVASYAREKGVSVGPSGAFQQPWKLADRLIAMWMAQDYRYRFTFPRM
jgi:hypothetical protein